MRTVNMIQAGSPLLLKKKSRTFHCKVSRNPKLFFQAICCNPAIFKYKDKQHFLIIKKFNNIIEVHNFVTQAAQCVHECCLSVEINVWQAQILCKVENDRCVHRTSEYRHIGTLWQRWIGVSGLPIPIRRKHYERRCVAWSRVYVRLLKYFY